MSEVQPKRFSLRPKEIPLVLEHADGSEHTYKLLELLGEQRNDFLRIHSTKIKTDVQGNPVGIADYQGMGSDLLEKCLVDSKGVLVPKSAIEKFPSEMQMELAKMASELSGLDKEAKKAVKNDSPAST